MNNLLSDLKTWFHLKWNRLLYLCGILEVTPYGKALYAYCQSILDGTWTKRDEVDAYEQDLIDMWEDKDISLLQDKTAARIWSAKSYIQYIDAIYGKKKN